MELFLLIPCRFNKKKKKMMTVGQTYCSNIRDWPLTPWNARFWHNFFSSPGRFFWVCFPCGERKRKGGNQCFQGAFYLAETISQKLVFDALNYTIVTCSLILHACHVWHSSKPQIWEKRYSFSIVFKYRTGGFVVLSYWWLYCTCEDSLHTVWTSRRASFSPSYK